jgi:hypothetical protein
VVSQTNEGIGSGDCNMDFEDKHLKSHSIGIVMAQQMSAGLS